MPAAQGHRLDYLWPLLAQQLAQFVLRSVVAGRRHTFLGPGRGHQVVDEGLAHRRIAGLRRTAHRRPAGDAMPLDQSGNEPGQFRLFDEIARNAAPAALLRAVPSDLSLTGRPPSGTRFLRVPNRGCPTNSRGEAWMPRTG